MCKMKCSPSKIIPILVVLLAAGGVSKRNSRKSENPLEDWQKRMLEKIQLAAREGGLEDSEWKGITKYDKDVCYTKACLRSALEVMQASNFTSNPCTMWQNYACARRINGVDNINQPERLMKKVERDTKDLLEHGLRKRKSKDTFLLNEAQVYYSQCKNKARNDKNDVKDILAYLSENYGDWPMITNRDPSPNFNWMDMVADLNRIERVGYTPMILHVKFGYGLDQASKNIKLDVGKTSFTITGEDFMKMISRLQKYSGKDRPVRLDQLKGAVQFINSVGYSVLYSSSGQQSLTIAELQQKTDEFIKKRKLDAEVDWLRFFQRVLNGSAIEVTPSTPKIDLPFDHIMNVLSTVNGYISRGEARPVANILSCQLITILLKEATALLDDLNSFKCTEQTGTREEICYARTIEIFGYSLGKTYLSIHYNDDVETPAIKDLMAKIQQGYINAVNSYDWMEDTTKEYLIDKISSMKLFVTQPEWTQDPKKLRQFYNGINASTDKNSSYPRNYLAVTRWEVAKKRSWINRMAHLTSWKQIHFYDWEWSRYLGNVQAQYHKILNEVRVEGGIVQSPLFTAEQPGFMNFGGLGMVLGHEIGHSFDVQGRTYNKDGEGPKEFWDAKSAEMYRQWVQRILKDYGSTAHQITETSAETIDAAKSINEDISDILGVYISYNSYLEYLKELESQGQSEKVLPGLKSFSPQKLFYMKYANMWCDKKGVQDRFNDLLESHSAGNVRATLPLKRSQQFADTFECPLPQDKK